VRMCLVSADDGHGTVLFRGYFLRDAQCTPMGFRLYYTCYISYFGTFQDDRTAVVFFLNRRFCDCVVIVTTASTTLTYIYLDKSALLRKRMDTPGFEPGTKSR